MRGFSTTVSLGAVLLASSAFAQEVSQTSALLSAASSVTRAASQLSGMASTAMSSGIPVASMTQSASSTQSASNSSAMASSTATSTSSSAIPSNSNGPMAGGGYGAFNVTPEIPINTSVSYNFSEPYRNQFHHSPDYFWMNDPNGLLYENGTYHLFYQYNPDGFVAANQSWGHAISQDLVSWEQLPVAIVATESELIFSGSAVMDYNNTSGFGNESSPAMVAIYATAHIENNILGRQAISIAYSNDSGLTFTKYNEGAPVINLNTSDLRDPNVKWDSEAQHWRLTAVLAETYQVIFFSSPDLKNWTELSRYGPGPATTAGVWECPDLISLPDPTNSSSNVSVLIVSVNPGGIAGGSGTWYLVGNYTNGTFTPSDRGQEPGGVENWLDYGADNYAGITFTDAPSMTFIGWMSNWWYGQEVPTFPWRSANTVARTLSLRQTANGTLQLHQEPVAALQKLYTPMLNSTLGQNMTFGNSSSPSTNQTLDGITGETLHINATIEVGNASTVGFNVRVGGGQYTAIGYNASASQVYIDRTNSGNSSFNETVFPVYHGGPIQLENGTIKLEILVDVASVEVFAESGNQTVLTDIIFPNASSVGVEFFTTNGSATIVAFQASNVQSIWGSNSTSNGTTSANGGNNSTSSAVGSATQTGGGAGPVSTGSVMSSMSSMASSMTSESSQTGATASAASVFSSATGLLPPTASVAQRYARAILRPDY